MPGTDKFALNAEKLTTWEPGPVEPLEGWDPRQYGEEATIADLVSQAQLESVIAAPAGAIIGYDYSGDSEGGGYIWLLDLYQGEGQDSRTLRLASSWRLQREIVPNEVAGRAAITSILEEAVAEANELLTQLSRWISS